MFLYNFWLQQALAILKRMHRLIIPLERVSRHLTAGFASGIFCEEKGPIARILISNPRSLNSLSLEMMRDLQRQVDRIKGESKIRVVLFKGEGDKAFCSGGDMKSLYTEKTSGNPKIAETFFREVHTLVYAIATMKPVQVSIWKGFVMGAGAGISFFGDFKIATCTTVFGMPLAKLSFNCAVGGAFFLSKLPGQIGLYLAMTSRSLRGKEAQALGISDYFVPLDRLEALEADLMKNVGDSAEEESVRRIVAKYSEQVEFKYPNEGLINDAFGQPNVQGIRKRLISMSSEWSLETLKELDSLNPFVLEVIFEQFKKARSLSLKENLQLDFALAMKQAHFSFQKTGGFLA